MEMRKAEMAQFAPFISELTQKGCRDDVLKLAKEDLELGYPQELVALYAEKEWPMERCKKFSSIMRADSDGELLRMLADGGFNSYQMQMLANFYEKGVPVAQLRDVGAKNLTAYDMEQTLKRVYQANREAETEKAGGSLEEKNLQEKIVSLAEELRQSEKELEKQQETANRRAVENAELRTKAEGLEKQVKELEQEKSGYESEKRSILEERDRFYRQNQTLMEEKDRLIADIEEVQKEKDEMGQRLKEMESRTLAETAEPQAAGQAGSRQQTAEPAGNNAGDSAGNDYLAAIRGRRDSGLIKQLTGKGLNPAQMEQVRMAVQAGLTGQEVNDLIDSGFSADEMAQAVEIVLAEKAYQ